MSAFYMGSLPEESQSSNSKTVILQSKGPKKRRPSSVVSDLNERDPVIKQAVSNLHHYKNATWVAALVLKSYIEFKRSVYDPAELDPRLEMIEEAAEKNPKSVHIEDLLHYTEFLETFTEEDIALKKLKDFFIKAVNYAQMKRVVSKKSSASSPGKREERESVIDSVKKAATQLLETAKSVGAYFSKIPEGYDVKAIGNVKRIAKICIQNKTLVYDATEKRGGARSYRSRPAGKRGAITKRRSRS